MAAEGSALSEEEEWQICMDNFNTAAIFQGRFAYFLMSIHFVNPNILNYVFSFDLYPYLWANMIYGITTLIFSRPSLKTISVLNRLTFGILGSLMFNHSSCVCWSWLEEGLNKRPYILTTMGFISGRFMMAHLLAFLYHMDTRTNIPGAAVPRNEAFERMYS